MVQVRIIMSMIEILFNMNTEQSVEAGRKAGLLERTEEPSLGQSFCSCWRCWITGRLLNKIRS